MYSNKEDLLNEILKKLCHQYNINNIKLDFTDKLSDINHKSEFDHNILTIKIRPNTTGIIAISQLYHEFEHARQYQNYKNYYSWWMNDKTLYKRFYHDPINLIEESARIFERTLGAKNGDFLFKNCPFTFFTDLDTNKNNDTVFLGKLINKNTELLNLEYMEMADFLKMN